MSVHGRQIPARQFAPKGPARRPARIAFPVVFHACLCAIFLRYEAGRMMLSRFYCFLPRAIRTSLRPRQTPKSGSTGQNRIYGIKSRDTIDAEVQMGRAAAGFPDYGWPTTPFALENPANRDLKDRKGADGAPQFCSVAGFNNAPQK